MPKEQWFAKRIAQASGRLTRRKTQTMQRIGEALQRSQGAEDKQVFRKPLFLGYKRLFEFPSLGFEGEI